ncbi:hypothetical protein BJV77DRAFT_1065269 [Russula vinacea]|nr:hypothetical protein BJV77DRAFT_1065269 [Russula vinacea]
MILFDRHKLRNSRLIRPFLPDNLLAPPPRLGPPGLLGEIGVFLYTFSVCRWPVLTHNSVTTQWALAQTHSPGADAQIPMRPTHSQTISGLFHDVYMHRAWKFTRRLHPHLVLFLGDMLKTGRSVESDEEFSTTFNASKTSFRLSQEWRPIYSGKLDVGLGVSNTFSKHVRQRYEYYFGPVNRHIPLANHSLVLLDSPGSSTKTTFARTRDDIRGSIYAPASFSDDRDYCDVTHKLPGSDKKIHEYRKIVFTCPTHHSTGLPPPILISRPHPVSRPCPCLLPRPDGTFIRLYIPAAGITVVILLLAQMRRARRAARLRLATASPLPSHIDLSQLTRPQPTPLPSPYSASSSYSYSYAYSNTPPGSQQGRDRIHFDIPRRDSKLLPFGKPRPPPIRPPSPPAHEEDENDGVRAHYLYMPPASPIPGDLLSRRSSARSSSPVAVATSPSARAWSFTYTFTIRGRRRRIAMRAPAWWPQWAGARRRGNGVWSAVGRDLGSVMGPALATWVFLVWWYSA